jgi:hypothetical protein
MGAVVHFVICGGTSTINRSTVTRFRHLRVCSAQHSRRETVRMASVNADQALSVISGLALMVVAVIVVDVAGLVL